MLIELALTLLQPTTTKAPEPKAALHPVITEVLYAVPKTDGDADQDGTRSATGDEFIELVNPHDKPINLKGYMLTDGKSTKNFKTPAPKPGDKADKTDKTTDKPGSKPAPKDTPKPGDDSRVRFTFPDLTLQPGEVAVVFNGYESHTPGPVGDSKAAAAKNDKFHNAYVFSMKTKSQYIALANNGDCVLLCDPDGHGIEAIYWGESDKKPEDAPAKLSKAPESRGSVQRSTPTGEFIRHADLPGEYNGKPFSPGQFGPAKK